MGCSINKIFSASSCSATAGRAGDIARSSRYSDLECTLLGDLKLTWVVEVGDIENVALEWTYRYEKNHK